MKHNRMVVVAALATLVFSVMFGWANAEDKKVKVKGIITARTGENLTLKTADGSVTVSLDDDTKVQEPKSLHRKKEMSAAILIPGLRVAVEGTGDPQSQVAAKSITFDSGDLETAEMIQAGLNPTAKQVKANQQDTAANSVQLAAQQEQIDANQGQTDLNSVGVLANQAEIVANAQRFSELSDYDTRGKLTVNFPVGSSTLSASDKTQLQQLAQGATGLTGYLIQVKGFADSSGSAAMNQQLSMDRAQEVVAYLMQDCKVPIRHIVAPGAMGTADPAATNETAQGRADNRRVEVKVLVNRGINS